jgi:hypothetical protein
MAYEVKGDLVTKRKISAGTSGDQQIQGGYVDINTTAIVSDSVARIKWNDGDGTIDIGLKGGNVTLQVGQEQVQRIYNETGSTLTDGQVVYVSGSQGQRLTVQLASASNVSTSNRTIGVVTESIANGAEGFVATNGIVRGINTSAFAEGSILWLSTTNGQLTTTRPSAPNRSIFVGFCVRQHAAAGSIFVHVQSGLEVGELHDVLLTSLLANQVLYYDGSVWKNSSLKTINSGSLLGAGDIALPTLAENTWTGQQTFKEVKDTVHTITDGAAFEIDPANGSIQVVTLGANRTPAATNFESGQVVLLGIDDGAAYTVTWTTVNPIWVKPGGTASAPTLATTGYTWVMLWKVGTVMYGAEVGKP